MKIYKKLFKYVPKEKYLGYISILFSIVSAVFTVVGYLCIYKFLDMLLVKNNLLLAKTMAIKTVIYLFLGAIIYFLSGYVSHKLGFRLETNLRKRGIDGLAKSGFRVFDIKASGYIRKTIDDNAAQTHTIVAHMIPDNSQAIIVPIGAIILGFMVSIRAGLCIILLVAASSIILTRMMGEKEFMKIYQESLNKLSAECVEYVRGMQVVKIFGGSVKSFKSLYNSIKEYSEYAYNYSVSCKKPYVWYQWIFFGLVSIVIVPLILFTDIHKNPRLLTVEMIMILFISGVLFSSFMKIMYLSMHIMQANTAVDKLEELFDDMQKDKLDYGDKASFENYDIEFENVSFKYDQDYVLNNLSFKLEQNKSYALVGSSGSGKSTIAKLISGFYKVNSGCIKIGGKPIGDYTQQAIINNIAFVFQDSKLFKKTIFENVAMADRDATYGDVMNVLEQAECNSILDKFSERENTLIGSKGVYLSGGEKQRIAIARAMLKKSNIVIMDEASAAIDPENEHELQKAFKNLMKNKTVIMIAHRLSSIKHLDEILVFDDGEIVERGTHDELMKKDTKYKKLQKLYEEANEWRVKNEEILKK